MSRPFPLQVFAADPAPVVTYGDAQFGRSKLDLRFDFFRSRMAASIRDRLAADPVNLVHQPRLQFFLRSENHDAKSGDRGEAQINRDSGKGLSKRSRRRMRRPHPLQGATSLIYGAVHQLGDFFQLLFLGAIRRQAIHYGMQLHGRSEEALEHRVMEFLRDARALRQTLVGRLLGISCGFVRGSAGK